jgi:hypothetical protein
MRTMALLVAMLVGGCTTAELPANDDAGYGRLPDLAPACTPNNDGEIARSELQLRAGLSARYLVNPVGTTVTVNPDGRATATGPEWDLTSTAGDVVELNLVDVSTAWFASSFPGASYATVTDLGSRTLGVFRVTDGAIEILGYASEQPNQTLLVYDRPILSAKLPIRLGDGWVSTGRVVNGRLNGQPFASTDTYRVSVDARGTAQLPYLTLDGTLRIQVQLTQTLPGGLPITRIQHLFFHECAGEVGRMASPPGETNPSFTTAAELRRLAL